MEKSSSLGNSSTNPNIHDTSLQPLPHTSDPSSRSLNISLATVNSLNISESPETNLDHSFPVQESSKFLLSFGLPHSLPTNIHIPAHPLYTSPAFRSSGGSPHISPEQYPSEDLLIKEQEFSLDHALENEEQFNLPFSVSYIPVKTLTMPTNDYIERSSIKSKDKDLNVPSVRSKSEIADSQKKCIESSSNPSFIQSLRSKLTPSFLSSDKPSTLFTKSQIKKKNDSLKKGQSISYAQLLIPSNYEYNPYVFNNPRFKQGKHQTVMKMNNNYSLSVIPYVNSKKLKDEVNEQFRLQNPWLPETMTLSKIRNLKADLFELLDHFKFINLPTVASGWVYFERLLMKRVVKKTNRKLYAIACFILSYKFNQLLFEKMPSEILSFIPRFDRWENLTAADIFRVEFEVYVLLDFSLQLQYTDIMPHIMQYLETKDLSFQDIFGTTENAFMQTMMNV